MFVPCDDVDVNAKRPLTGDPLYGGPTYSDGVVPPPFLSVIHNHLLGF